MSLPSKAIRKLGLGDTAARLLAPLAKDGAPLPEPAEARTLLTKLRPDTGGSALITEAQAPASADFDVCVIIPVYNAAPYLEECLQSVLSQKTAFRLQIIAVDDGSADASGAMLDAVQEARFTVVHQENRGAAAARNRGLALCRARYILFLDADDALFPDSLDPLVRCAEEQDAAIVEAGYTTVDAEGRTLRRFAHAAGGMDPRACTGFPHGKLFRAEQFSRLRFPEGYLFEDSVLAQLVYPLAVARGDRAVGLDTQLLRFRIHSQNTTSRNRVRPGSIDTLWVTLSLARDREALGLPDDQAYYEYLLSMLSLSLRRTELLGEEVRRAIFVLFRAFLLGRFDAFSTERAAWRVLEQAVRDGDYGRCRLFSSLH